MSLLYQRIVNTVEITQKIILENILFLENILNFHFLCISLNNPCAAERLISKDNYQSESIV